MKTYRESNIALLAEAIEGDEFFDLPQIDTKGDLDPDFISFVRAAFKNTSYEGRLEIGPGSGRLLDYDLCCGYYLEPSLAMINRLTARVQGTATGVGIPSEIAQGVIEYIPFGTEDEPAQFELICFYNGFFQVRSDYEALIEVNRHLKIGGKFSFNLFPDDSEDIVCGRVLGPQNYLRILKEFGFDPLDVRLSDGYFTVVKRREVDAASLRKVQFVQQADGNYKALNLKPDRDYHLL